MTYIPKYKNPFGVLKTIPRRAYQKVQLYYNLITGSHYGELLNIKILDGTGTDIVSLDNGVIRVTPETELRGTLFNEFVETQPATYSIRSAKEYKNLPDEMPISDGKIPKGNFNLFAGIEDGHFKIDTLEHFLDTTTIIPVRNITKGTKPITSFYLETNGVTYEDIKQLEKNQKQYRNIYSHYNPVHFRASNPFISPYGFKDIRTVTVPQFLNGKYKNTKIELTDEELKNLAKRVSMLLPLNYIDSTDIFIDKALSAPNLSSYLQQDAINKKLIEDIRNANLRFISAKNQSDQSNFYDLYNESDDENKVKLFHNMIKPLTKEELYFYDQYIHDKAKSKVENNSLIVYSKFPLNQDSIPSLLLTMYPRQILNYYNISNKGIYPNKNKLNSLYNLINPIGWKYSKDWELIWKPKVDSLENEIETVQSKMDYKNGIHVITTDNDTIPVSNYNAAILDKKIVFGNPSGGIFIANFNNLSQEQLDKEVNPYLKKNPSYLFMPDMGAYSLYGLLNGKDPGLILHTHTDLTKKPAYSDYWNLFTEAESKAPYNSKVHYLVGVQKSGGKINYLNIFKK